MQKTKAELYDLIADLKTKKDFQKEINIKYKKFDELLDKDTIAYLIVDELGRNNQSVTKIVNLTPDDDFTVIGKVLNISNLKTFKRRNGTPGKVINLEIADDTATCPLVLWNGDIDLIKNKKIQPGTILKIINGYTKRGYRGNIEINLGRWGLLEIESISTFSQQEKQKPVGEEINGILIHKEPTKAFFQNDGEFGFTTTIMIKEQNIKKEIILWNQCVKEIQLYKIGENIILKNVIKKWKNGKTEFHVSQKSSIEKSK